MILLKAEHLGVRRGIKHILKNICWEIRTGERWVVFGENGCGKTTLLSVLAGYSDYTDGSIWILENSPSEDNIISLRKKIGWVSASFFDRYFTRESILDIVLGGISGRLCCDYSEIEDSDIRKAKTILRRLDMNEHARYSYDMLSQGQRQKVLIARAFIADAKVLILDEPCNGMDILSREKFLHELEAILKVNQMGLVYVTHHPDEIMPYFNKAILMKNGQIFKMGEIEQVFNKHIMDQYFEHPSVVSWNDKNLTLHLNLKSLS